MFEKLCDNLNLLMAKMRINANELARRTGLPASTIKKIRNRDNPNPTLTTLLPLAQFFSVSLSQLIGEDSLSTFALPHEHIRSLHCVPLLSWEESLTWPSTISQARTTIRTEHAYSVSAYALLVEEDDWSILMKGTALVIDPTVTPDHRDFIIVHKQGQKIPSLKQALYDEGQLYLKPIHQGYNLTILTSEHKIFGVVMEYRNQIKKVVSNPKIPEE